MTITAAREMARTHEMLAERAIAEHAAGKYAERGPIWRMRRVCGHSRWAERYRALAEELELLAAA